MSENTKSERRRAELRRLCGAGTKNNEAEGKVKARKRIRRRAELRRLCEEGTKNGKKEGRVES